MTSLREEIKERVWGLGEIDECDAYMVTDWALALIKIHLLSEEAVIAGARALTGAKWDNGHKIVSGVNLSAKEMADIEARAALTAAIATLEKADG